MGRSPIPILGGMRLEATPAPADAAHRSPLVGTNLMLVSLLVIHSLDHALRQSATVPAAAAILGLAGLAFAVVVLGLSLAGRRLAALGTAVAGFGTAVGFAAVHLLPDWGPFSQPYADIPVDALSWVAMLLPLVGAAIAGTVGVRALRRGSA
jgi:hypothetical protein